MGRYYGKVGYLMNVEESPGVWVEDFKEIEYSYNILRSSKKNSEGRYLNDDISFSNRISIVADPFGFENFIYIKYIEIYGIKMKVESVELKYPRLILEIGGKYNG